MYITLYRKHGCGICFHVVLLELVARREARRDSDSMASAPQAPYTSTTMGTQTHPSSLHFPSLASCFLCSVALAATPAESPASKKTLELSSDVTDMSNAAGLPTDQLGIAHRTVILRLEVAIYNTTRIRQLHHPSLVV